MTKIATASLSSIEEAAALLRDGEIVAFPTETVYGLGANALDGMAVAKIFAAKNRPSFNPLIVHVASREAAEAYVEMDARAKGLADMFWPGPLTMILPKKEAGGISDLVSAGLPTIGIRVPAHPVARQLLEKVGLPIAAPSANASGEPSATTPRHVADSLKENVPFILAGGACSVGLESTVLDMMSDVPVILRPGAVSAEDLEPGESLLAFGPIKFMGIKGGGAAKDLAADKYRNLSESGDLHEAAANLFSMLRDLDHAGAKTIAVMNIPGKGLGLAINDRLARAALGR